MRLQIGLVRLRPISESLISGGDDEMALGAGDHGSEKWLAIDPHGVAGDPGYEVGALIYNPGGRLDPLNQPDPRRAIVRRVDVLAEALGWHRSRVRGWCLAQSVLSSWWTYEDHARFDPSTLTVAQYLEHLEP